MKKLIFAIVLILMFFASSSSSGIIDQGNFLDYDDFDDVEVVKT